MHLPSFHSFSWSRISTSSLAAFRSICSSILARRAIALEWSKTESACEGPTAQPAQGQPGFPCPVLGDQAKEDGQPWGCPQGDAAGHCRGTRRDGLWAPASARLPSKPGLRVPEKLWGVAIPELSSSWNTDASFSNHLNPLITRNSHSPPPRLCVKQRSHFRWHWTHCVQ